MNTAVHQAFVAALEGRNDRVVQLAHPHITFLAQNLAGKPALVAKVELSADLVVPDGRGFTVTTYRSGVDSFVRIASNEAGVALLFLKLVDYVLERTAEARDSREAAALLVSAVDEFKRFTQRRSGRLGEDEIRGLIAELLLLIEIQAGDATRTWEAFNAWGGPFGALHDFEFAEGNAIEVKSTHRPPSEIRISTPAQTQPIPDGLDLVVLPLEKVAPGADADINFIELVEEVSALAVARGGDVADLWDSALIALGLDLTDQYYEQWRFARGEWLRFRVVDGFPGISEGDLPSGVVKVTYSLRLEALGAFAADFEEFEVLV